MGQRGRPACQSLRKRSPSSSAKATTVSTDPHVAIAILSDESLRDRSKPVTDIVVADIACELTRSRPSPVPIHRLPLRSCFKIHTVLPAQSAGYRILCEFAVLESIKTCAFSTHRKAPIGIRDHRSNHERGSRIRRVIRRNCGHLCNGEPAIRADPHRTSGQSAARDNSLGSPCSAVKVANLAVAGRDRPSSVPIHRFPLRSSQSARIAVLFNAGELLLLKTLK